MKKRCFLFLMMLMVLQSPIWGQLSKGAITLQGELGAGHQWAGPEGPEGIYLNWSPGFGIMLTDHFMTGVAIGGGAIPSDNLDTEALLQPFVRYYFNSNSSKKQFFAGTYVGIPIGDVFPFTATALGGVDYFITPNFALEGTLGFTYLEDQENLISLGLGIRSFFSRADRTNMGQAEGAMSSGSWLVGVSQAALGYQNSIFQFNLSPNVGYFLTSQLVLGGRLGSSIATGNNGNNRTYNAYSFRLQPFARYYAFQTGRWHWFGEVGGGIDLAGTNQEDLWEFRSRNFFAQATLGSNLFLAPSVALELSLNLSREFDANIRSEWNQDVTPIPDIDGSIESRTLLVAFQVGFQFFLDNQE